ncbi:MAG: ADP-ribosylglycohydrolase family protein, partial [Verrucomicrobiae bacterium]|nr:ADP-ribosylglycohydrolase family protein [Verrucomicrobiae bacterium]
MNFLNPVNSFEFHEYLLPFSSSTLRTLRIRVGQRKMTIQDRVTGCLLSGAVADAFGSNFENMPSGFHCKIQPFPQCSITDDTQLTLATCEAIVQNRGIKPEKVAAAFSRKFREEGIRGIGSSTLKSMRDLDAGAHWFLAGASGEKSAGNGAAMRIAPVGFCRVASLNDLSFIVRDITSITHKNDEAYSGALAVALCIHLATKGACIYDVFSVLQNFLPDTGLRDALGILRKSEDLSIMEASTITGNSGYVVESVPLAIFAASKSPTLDILTIIQEVVSCGGDTDTIASISAQIAGAFTGISSDVVELVEKLEEKEYI